MLYYAQQGYTAEPEVDIAQMKRNFMGICGGDFDDWVMLTFLPFVSRPADYPFNRFTHVK
jgi:hypothetical protein